MGEASEPSSKPVAIAGASHVSNASRMPSSGYWNQNHQMHAAVLEHLERSLPAGSFVRTFQGCKANIAFSACKDAGYLPLQVRAATLNDGRRHKYIFHVNHGVDGSMLLLCRPLPGHGGTLVIPETGIPRAAFAFTCKERTKYYPFIVHDGQLGGVLKGIYDAVTARQGEFTLPSGKVIDVLQLKLKGIQELSTPTSACNQKAREFSLLRQQWLPGLVFSDPISTYTIVNAVVKGLRIADAVAKRCPGQSFDSAYQVIVQKHKNVASRKVPYEEGDFDAMWVFHPDMVHMWLIPAHVLVEKGVLATSQQPGKQGLYLYDHSYTTRKRPGRKADLWTREYLLSSQDPDLMGKVLRTLKAAKP